MLLEYLLDKPSYEASVNNDQLKPPAEIKSTKDYWEIKHLTDNKKFIDNEQKSSKKEDQGPKKTSEATKSDFPFECSISGQEMNGQNKFVFGLQSKALVSEQALREVNIALFPKTQAAGNSEIQSGALHPVYDEKNEKSLICPVTNSPFGRPIQLYPQTPAEIKRMQDYVPVGKLKKKKKNKEKQQNNDDEPSVKKCKK